MKTFFQKTGWQPDDAKAVAGGDTDTSRDYEYTDWAALDRFVEQWLDNIARAEPIRRSPAKSEATA